VKSVYNEVGCINSNAKSFQKIHDNVDDHDDHDNVDDHDDITMIKSIIWYPLWYYDKCTYGYRDKDDTEYADITFILRTADQHEPGLEMLEEEEDLDNAINANFISVKPNFTRKEIVGFFVPICMDYIKGNGHTRFIGILITLP